MREVPLDASHFRKRAAQARETAQYGDDMRLTQMLIDVACDLDAEAEAIEAIDVVERRGFPRLQPTMAVPGEALEARLYMTDVDADPRQVQIINLSLGGARFHVDRPPTPGSEVTLELANHALRLGGTILRVPGEEAAMIFDAASRANPELSRILSLSSATGQEQS
jgi:hypothetical protein